METSFRGIIAVKREAKVEIFEVHINAVSQFMTELMWQ